MACPEGPVQSHARFLEKTLRGVHINDVQYTRNHVNENRTEISRANGAGRRPEGMLQELSTVEGIANDSIVNSG